MCLLDQKSVDYLKPEGVPDEWKLELRRGCEFRKLLNAMKATAFTEKK